MYSSAELSYRPVGDACHRAPGDLEHVHLGGEVIYLQNSAYVASTPGVEVESKWQGMMKGFFSGESLFLIRCSGQGDLWFNTYGALLPIDVTSDYVVDTGKVWIQTRQVPAFASWTFPFRRAKKK